MRWSNFSAQCVGGPPTQGVWLVQPPTKMLGTSYQKMFNICCTNGIFPSRAREKSIECKSHHYYSMSIVIPSIMTCIMLFVYDDASTKNITQWLSWWSPEWKAEKTMLDHITRDTTIIKIIWERCELGYVYNDLTFMKMFVEIK